MITVYDMNTGMVCGLELTDTHAESGTQDAPSYTLPSTQLALQEFIPTAQADNLQQDALMASMILQSLRND